tara:strand:+ start:621 stop:1646 length:1026 start_codon:yes stop_codon:yes gene_type:complete
MNPKNLNAVNKIPKVLANKIRNKKINQIFKKFEKSLNINEDLGVAVSGGPDSLALAFLAKIYSLKRSIKVKFFIVDHKLRKESTEEARIVKKTLKKFKINLEILTWRGEKPKKNIQSIARKKRYDLIFAKCEKYKINNLLTGHHQNDLFENFFIRMTRGSGLKGLISLDKKNKIGEKNILRPLIDQKKENLKFISKKVFNFYIKDPSNNDEKFQRIKIRKLIKSLEKDGLNQKKFLMTIRNLKSSNSVVDFYVSENLKKNTFFNNNNNKMILNRDFFLQPYEIIFRGLSESLKLVSKRYHFVRGKKLDKMIGDIQNNRLFRVTLGGCIVEKVNQSVIISKE